MKAIDLLITIVLVIIVIFIIIRFFFGIGVINNIVGTLNNTLNPNYTSTILVNSTTSVPTTTIAPQGLYSYMLGLINSDRAKYGLSPVTLSNESSAQQHASSMLVYDYFSHWDIYGMKPYMRYTLVGGTESVYENAAYESYYSCNIFCKGINVTAALAQMENNMMYNDSICCNNGHRLNILNPYHNEVSIGIAYNSTTVYLVEDFIDNYIIWSPGTPSVSPHYETSLQGTIQDNYDLSAVQVVYDTPVQNMTVYQLDNTDGYGYGTTVGGIVKNSNYYYPNLTTIVADKYSTQGNNFDISFNMNNLVSQYGPGEYTVLLFLNSSNATDGSFVGSSYTIFVNNSLQQYSPRDI